MASRTDGAGERSSAQEMPITDHEIARRKEFLQFTEQDVQRLQEVNDLAGKYVDEIVEEFYGHLLSLEEARPFFRDDPNLIEHVKSKQKEYFLRLTQGNYDAQYVASRVQIGAIHERIGLPTKLYLAMYNWYLRAIAVRLFSALRDDPDRALAAFQSISKLVFFDMGFAIDTYIQKRERTISRQTAQEYLAAIVESTDDAIIGIDLDGIIRSWNPGAQMLYGYGANEILGRPIALLYPPEGLGELTSVLERLKRGERIERFETARVRKGGRRVDVSVTTSPIKDPAGNIIGASKIDRDITERKRVEETIRELSTPVLSVRSDLLILPIVGLVDSGRALQITEQLLNKIRDHRAKVAVLDITGVPLVDSRVASHLIQTVEAARLMGCVVIVTGISPAIARSLVAIGVDLSRVTTRADLQSGIEEAEQILGYQVIRTDGRAGPTRQTEE
ncbi:MAG: PAS domain S-box protein [Chloroflexota bacterium]|nr:MAG: PAS domain S-box protein [Chloroflexota bacterium]